MIYISKAIFSRDGGSNTITKLQLKGKRKNTQGSQSLVYSKTRVRLLAFHIAAFGAGKRSTGCQRSTHHSVFRG